MKSQWEYELKGEELKILKEIAKEENKTLQELCDEIIIEFVNKNMKYTTSLIKEQIPREQMIAYRLNELVSCEMLNENLEYYLDSVIEDKTSRVVIIKDDAPQVVMISIDEYERLKEISIANGDR
jgi:diacylglycerol kinase